MGNIKKVLKESAKKLPSLEMDKNAVCPKCGGHRIVKYKDVQVFYGCLDCGWKELDE